MVTDALTSLASTSGFPLVGGGAVGYFAGFALKKVLKFVAIGLGLIALALGFLELQKWITVNWPTVEHGTRTIAEKVAQKAYAITQHMGSEIGAGATGFIGLLIGMAKG